MKKTFQVLGMTCSACVLHVEKAVTAAKGVTEVNVSLLTNQMWVTFDESAIAVSTIEQLVSDAGYEAKLKDVETNDQYGSYGQVLINAHTQWLKRRWWTSLFFLLILFYFTMGHMFSVIPFPHLLMHPQWLWLMLWLQLLLTIPIVLLNKSYFITGLKTLIKGSPTMDTLVALGSGTAFLYSFYIFLRVIFTSYEANVQLFSSLSNEVYFESAATILTLITLGKYLESLSKGKTTSAIEKLMDLSPQTAWVVRGALEQEVMINEVVVGDRVIVKPGQRIPVDGKIIQGESSLDVSALTGESIPVVKQLGDEVLTSSINGPGSLVIEATQVGANTTLAQIIKLVENAASLKAPISRMADKVSAVFVPVVIMIALITFSYWALSAHTISFALSMAIAVLVISCPCALGLATPVAIMVGIGKGASNGLLIKSPASLELAHKIDTIILDKTGTLTLGKPVLTDLIPLHNLNTEELLSLAASLEKPSEHPLATAIIKAAEDKKIKLSALTNFESHTGLGVQAKWGNDTYRAGNEKFISALLPIADHIKALSQSLASMGKTVFYVASKQCIVGLIAVSDTLKADSRLSVKSLQSMGLRVVMLTGDNQTTAQTIAKEAGIDAVHANVLPADKAKVVKQYQDQGSIVAMVGDGINDAPALVQANLGIAIGKGTDIAIDASDIILMHSNLTALISVLKLSKATYRIIKQNLFWAFLYNIICIPLAAGVFFPSMGLTLNPMIGAAAMSLSSVTVVINALRLRRFHAENQTIVELKHPSGQNVIDTTVKTHSMRNLFSKFSKKNSEEQPQSSVVPMKEYELKIKGMSCSHCSGRVENSLNAMEGVQAKVDLATGTAQVQASSNVSMAQLQEKIASIGYEVTEIS